MATATPTKKAPVKKPAAKKSPPAKKVATVKKVTPVKKAAPTKVAAKVADAPGADLLAMELLYLTHAELQPAPDNLRATLTDLSDLADSIAATGLQQPIVVTTEISEASAGRPQHVIVAGHRRHGAIGQLIKDGRWPKGKRIPCVCGPSELTAAERVVAMLVENLQRVDLDPIEEATGYQRLSGAGWTNTRISAATGRHVNRIGDRLRLLSLPPSWWPKIAAGELTLGFAADIVKAHPDVQTVLAARSAAVPSVYQLAEAIRDHRHHQATLDVKDACKARDLVVSTKDKYNMAKTHVEVASCTPKQLAKVLLPAVHGSHPPLHVTLSGKWENPPKVTVWQVRTTRPLDQVDSTKTPYQLWTDQCHAIQTAHVAAINDYDARLAAALVDHCLTLDTKDVAQAAMHYQINVAFKDRSVPALKLGWVKPTRVDKATVEATLDEWYSHARNFTAAVAYGLFANRHFTPTAIKAQWEQIADTVVGPRPVRPENPPSPDIPPHDEEDNNEEEPDENAHLDTVDDGDDDTGTVD